MLYPEHKHENEHENNRMAEYILKNARHVKNWHRSDEGRRLVCSTFFTTINPITSGYIKKVDDWTEYTNCSVWTTSDRAIFNSPYYMLTIIKKDPTYNDGSENSYYIHATLMQDNIQIKINQECAEGCELHSILTHTLLKSIMDNMHEFFVICTLAND